MNMLAHSVARKFAARFEVGDIILYGKYKNKRGKIVSFGKNDKGQPTIIVEPIPKGRKQNKEMGLYKIWTLPKEEQDKAREEAKAEKAEKKEAMDKATPRVVNTWNKKLALDKGKTWENAQWRIHRYADSIQVKDLTNAGKRGKKVKVWTLLGGIRSLPFESTAMELVMLAKRGEGVNRMVQALKEATEIGFGLDEREERGVDVAPGNFGPLEIRGDHCLVQVGWKDFMVKNTDDKFNEETCIPAIKGGIQAIPAFYRWVDDNKAKIEKMEFREILKAMEDLGVPYHQYCAID